MSADLRGSRAATGYFTTTTVPTNACERHVLVDYDMTTGAVACEWCPNKTKVGLLNIQRSFEQQVYVTDAQYAYWPQWKPSMGVTSSATQPCFASITPRERMWDIPATAVQPTVSVMSIIKGTKTNDKNICFQFFLSDM